jgi:4-hydroxybenzoate polyprenyltransferase
MNRWIKHLDYFFVSRPILFLPGWATLIAGYCSAAGETNLIQSFFNGTIKVHYWNSALLLNILLFSMLMGGSFILNQLKDVATDRQNKKLFFFGDGYIPYTHGYVVSISLILVGLFVSSFVSKNLFFVLLAFAIVTGYFYNFSPFEFKNKPILGLFANIIMGWLAFGAGWVLADDLNNNLIISSLPYIFFNTSLYFLTTLPDIEGDKKSRKITFPVRYGFGITIWQSIFFYFVAVLLSYLFKDQFCLTVFIIHFPLMIRLIAKRDTCSAVLAVKFGILAFCLVVSLKMPIFLIIMFGLFLFTRIYYKKRFNFDYPSFKGI